MKHHLTALLSETVQGGDFDPSQTAGKVRAAIVAFLAVGLALASLWGVFTYARKGHAAQAAVMVATCIICLIPAAIAAPIALGRDITGWLGIF
jgi:hypothetical protein